MLHLLPVAILAQLAYAFALSCPRCLARPSLVHAMPRVLYQCLLWLRLGCLAQTNCGCALGGCARLGSAGEGLDAAGLAQPVAVWRFGLGAGPRT